MKPRARTTPFAILGMLRFHPMSGYDIRKEAAASIGHFWSESYGQLYPALRELAAAGLVRRRVGGPAGQRERQIYEITERGLEALQAWRRVAPRSAPVRNELLLKLFFADSGSLGPELEWIDDLLTQESSALREFRRIRAALRRQERHPSLPFWLMALSHGEHRSRAIVRWCRETKAALRAVSRGSAAKGRTQ
jgi:PadR family transcriptional regulator AphA